VTPLATQLGITLDTRFSKGEETALRTAGTNAPHWILD
jgi:hypothetical protein